MNRGEGGNEKEELLLLSSDGCAPASPGNKFLTLIYPKQQPCRDEFGRGFFYRLKKKIGFNLRSEKCVTFVKTLCMVAIDYAPAMSRAKTETEKAIPQSLIYEVLDGKPLYRKGYKDVLNKTKTLEEIMACSTLQSEVIGHLLRTLYRRSDESKYRIHTNEPGLHVNHKNNLASDIFIYDKKVLTAEHINNKYANVTPKIAIEVDVAVEFEGGLTFENYTGAKNSHLLKFGAEKVLWILTKEKKVWVETLKDGLQILDWNTDIEIFDGITFNIGEYLKSEGIE